MKALLVVIAMTGCQTYDETWQMRVALPPQPIARSDLGISDQADIGVGELWLSIHDDGTGDVAYPVVAQPGGGLMLESVFDRSLDASHAELVTSTRLSHGTEPADKHPDTQYATVYIDALLADRLRGQATGPLSTGRASLQLEIEVPVPPTCSAPPTLVRGTATGCFATCPTALDQLGDGTYMLGPLHIALDVRDQMCTAAS